MKAMAVGLAGFAVICGVAAGQATQGHVGARQLRESVGQMAVIAAVDAEVQSENQFRTVHRYVMADPTEEKWRRIPWEPDLWNGRVKAAEQDKPLFIWAMNGDPLGCV
ncbi:hypothetical protein HN371_23550 [Candidatus Poribacteria bacterium]|jgi:hypothetical protein|nr:hypothetical protein [Candidatus Poribacteria bacterium]MBT5531531.1 hypothetical protein [Candidatus Poribacteria bacterium]MBT5711417.1 hypothetical protein [Candidatus Poribacteria bacterium]MBT7099991.1 hypothetical protein [Candidatus Poribacteria bacterium]MBT7808878.1 hypothetical protein [Candidatus Poribacteria bacterium]